MKYLFCMLSSMVVLSAGVSPCPAQDDLTIVAPASEAAEGLDLEAVAGLFKDTKNLEEFEKALNDPETGVNNLDLNEDGEVDFIRVVEETADQTHVIILQVPLGKDDFQDVATIEVERNGDDEYNAQVRGAVVIYGENYYVAPVRIRVSVWPIISVLYRPGYRPYRSAYYHGYYPRWWKPFRPVKVTVYHNRTVKFRSTSFKVTKTGRVKSVTRVRYRPRTSTLVKKRTTVTRTKDGRKKTVTKTKRKKR